MAITIGDQIPEECTKIKHLPLRALQEEDATDTTVGVLAYNTDTNPPDPLVSFPSSVRHKPPHAKLEGPLGSPGMDEVFAEGGLEICNRQIGVVDPDDPVVAPHPQSWGKQHFPIGCHVIDQFEPSDEDEIPGFPVDLNWVGVVVFSTHSHQMSEASTRDIAFPATRGGLVQFEDFVTYYWTTDMGDHVWDFINPGLATEPVSANKDINPGDNDIFGAQPWCDSSLENSGKVTITSLWSPPISSFPPPSIFPNAQGFRPVATVKLDGESRGNQFVLDPVANKVLAWPPVTPGSPFICKEEQGFQVFSKGQFKLGWGPQIWRRAEWNANITCNSLTPVPGKSIPYVVSNHELLGFSLEPCFTPVGPTFFEPFSP